MTKDLGIYEGNDLGANYTKNATCFKVWCPTASQVKLRLYKAGAGDCLISEENMQKESDGIWVINKNGDYHTVYYTYLVEVDGVIRETHDPYAVACGVNGNRSMVCDLATTNPMGFLEDKGPIVKDKTQLIVTEISVADTTADVSSACLHRGKYLGLTELNTKNANGNPTGIDYIKDLGVTHVQIMPSYDFGSIDEASDEEQYNWGYDPVNYNVPEGSYSTDPFNGLVRIKEYKEMVKAFHDNGIGVIMDVVYNHTYDIENSCFHKTVPGYYFRYKENGQPSDASACGNEIASDMPMMRKYIINSLKHWVNEYHIDGFRFDLMGVLDIDTLNIAYEELSAINPDIILYGEGWTGGDSTLDFDKRAMKINVSKIKGFGMFSDDIRDNVKGHVFELKEKGFINGGIGYENSIRNCVVGCMKHPQIDVEDYTYSDIADWAKEPSDVVNYLSCHDNLTLWDKLTISCPTIDKETKLSMNRLGASIIFTSQGIPFFLLGEESARSKPINNKGDLAENSYNLPLFTNSLKYDLFDEFSNLRAFYKGLIAFRKSCKAFHLQDENAVASSIRFIEDLPKQVVAFSIITESELTFIVYNASENAVSINLPTDKAMEIHIIDDKASSDSLGTIKDQTSVNGLSCLACVCEI